MGPKMKKRVGEKHRYTFAVGLFSPRKTVTVHAGSLSDARSLARYELDRRAERKNEEPPVGWTIVLIDGPSSIKPLLN